MTAIECILEAEGIPSRVVLEAVGKDLKRVEKKLDYLIDLHFIHHSRSESSYQRLRKRYEREFNDKPN